MTDAPPQASDTGNRRESSRVPIGQTGARPIPPVRHHVEENPHGKRLAVLSLTALGVVYGDIGTSPLYAIKECFKPEYGLQPTAGNIYGLLSLIVWALLLVVSVKYVAFILRADNRGEGGVLALLALVLQREHRDEDRRRRAILIAIGIFGGAFLYGDGMITPAISVLSAVEGSTCSLRRSSTLLSQSRSSFFWPCSSSSDTAPRGLAGPLAGSCSSGSW